MNQSPPSKISHMSELRQQCLPVLLVACIGVGISLTTVFMIRSWERQNIKEAFRRAAEDRSIAVKSTFETELDMLELVRSALISDGRIERKEFREILDPFLSRSHDILAVEWVPRIPDSRRAEFEAAARGDGIEGFRITELDKDGHLVAALQREEYFPIHFIGPRVGNSAVYGYDVASESTRHESLNLACDTGKTVASGQFAFIQEEKSQVGFLVSLPVYLKDKPVETIADRRENLAGFVLGVFRPNEMIESALEKLQPEGIDIGLYDPLDAASWHSFHVHASRTRKDLWEPVDSSRLLDATGARYLAKLDVAGHPWTIVCAPTPEFEAAHASWWPGGVLAAGLLFTVLLVGYLLLSIDQKLHLEEKVHEQTADICNVQEDVLCRLALAAQWCDEETGMHVRRMGILSEALAGAAGWFGPEVDAIRQAAPMHDIGKIGVPEAILRKPDKLTPQEFEVMKTHTLIGAEILAGSKAPMLQMAQEIAQNHHERWDGNGYPRGLAGKDIPESARIMAIVDAYDTLTHDSVNRPAMSEKEALAKMQRAAGKHFDPDLLADFFRHLPEIRRIADRHPDCNRSGGRATFAAGVGAYQSELHATPMGMHSG